MIIVIEHKDSSEEELEETYSAVSYALRHARWIIEVDEATRYLLCIPTAAPVEEISGSP